VLRDAVGRHWPTALASGTHRQNNSANQQLDSHESASAAIEKTIWFVNPSLEVQRNAVA
jgi:hypothetical protein